MNLVGNCRTRLKWKNPCRLSNYVGGPILHYDVTIRLLSQSLMQVHHTSFKLVLLKESLLGSLQQLAPDQLKNDSRFPPIHKPDQTGLFDP